MNLRKMPLLEQKPDSSALQIDFGSILINTKNGSVKEMFAEHVANGLPHDIVGASFEKSLEYFERKNTGQYYTPKEIVEYILSQLDINEDSKILDPSCGCGSFIMETFELLKKKYGMQSIKNIYGVDLNDNAANVTRLCLFRNVEFNKRYIDTIKGNIKTGNSIVSNPLIDKNAFNWGLEYREVLESGGFDVIIGNPPYVTLSQSSAFDPEESFYSSIINGPVNAATLMICRSLDLLKQGGILAFLLPKSILYVNSYSKFREYISDNTEIQQIYDLGPRFEDVRGEQFILILKKSKPSIINKVKISVFEAKLNGLNNQPTAYVEQNELKHSGRFLTFENKEYYSLVSKLAKIGVSLETYTDGKIFRGLPIGGNHTTVLNKPNSERVIRGKDIAKFRIKTLPLIDSAQLQKQSDSKIREIKKKKIVLQNIFSAEAGIISSYDAKGLLTLDTVTNIIVKSDFEGKYILALLNSKLINFYIMYYLFNKSRLTMHADKAYLGLIPVINEPDKRIVNSMISIIDDIVNGIGTVDPKEKQRDLDKLVYRLYSLNKEEIILIESAVNKIMSRKSIW
ncbi:MAG: N-6 DNA methylase [Elusimicrobia bacterium]|nr:N-6 DNA methylase [Candidatus Liberimonas magnetica]